VRLDDNVELKVTDQRSSNETLRRKRQTTRRGGSE